MERLAKKVALSRVGEGGQKSGAPFWISEAGLLGLS